MFWRCWSPVFEKSAPELKPKEKSFRCKSTVNIGTLKVKTLNRIDRLPERTTSAAEHNIDIVCIQEHKYYHCKVEIKYHYTGNGWAFRSASTWKNSVNAVREGVGMLLSPHTLKSFNSTVKIPPRMVDKFNANPGTTIITCYCPTNASDETNLITFYNELSSLVRCIPKHYVLIIGGDMNAQIGKDENNKFCCHNSSYRNGEHVTEFSFKNGQTCPNTKFL